MRKPKPLAPDLLRRTCDPDALGFETTAELTAYEGMLGQDRAVEAIQTAVDMDVVGYNLFVIGPPGSGRHTFVGEFITKLAAERQPAKDWCYVANFADPRRPRALSLPAGRAKELRKRVAEVIAEAGSALSAAFESDDYRQRRRALEEVAKAEQQRAFEEIDSHAGERGLVIVETATGFAFLPRKGKGPAPPQEVEELPEEERAQLERDGAALAEELRAAMLATRQRMRKMRAQIQTLDREVAHYVAEGLLNELVDRFGDEPNVLAYLNSLRDDIADKVELFTGQAERLGPAGLNLMAGGQLGDVADGALLERRYGVNVIVDHSETRGAPVVREEHPAFVYLIGQIEHLSRQGALITDHNLIRAGALHRANGGYLVLDVRKVLTEPLAWEALKRSLRARRIDIKSLGQAYSVITTVSLEPEPIPLAVKVVLIGERRLYYLLHQLDPELGELFKVVADFDDQMPRSDANERDMARLIGQLSRKDDLLPLDKAAVARLIEESSRLAGDSEALSAQLRRTADLVRESHHLAAGRGAALIEREDVVAARTKQIRRQSRIRDRMHAETLRGTLLIDTSGDAVGQINALAAFQIGDVAFARPSRITATATIGSGKVVDIEREVDLGGPLHSKGVLILSRYLAHRYARERPLSLSASLVFEQSYGGVDGDSASAAELCALLSALAGLPIRQSLAITGSVNQRGQVQAIGAVNHKIEGFFDLCESRELTGDQGVLIPTANVPHLMLRPDVVEAAREGRFHVYAVATIDECLHVLTGVAAGRQGDDGTYPNGTVNAAVTQRLDELAEARRAFGSKDSKDPDEAPKGGS